MWLQMQLLALPLHLPEAEIANFKAAVQSAMEKKGSYRNSVLSEVVSSITRTATPRITAKELRMFREYWDHH
jgi:hypothetical protein